MNYGLRLIARTAGLGAAVAGLAACSILAGLSDFDGAVDAAVDSGNEGSDGSVVDVPPTPMEAAVGGDDAGASDDASSLADDAEGGDAAVDASDGDGGDDAADGTDAADAADAIDGGDGSTRFCVTAHTAQTIFCKDFDDGTAATAGWTGTFFRDPANAVFPPDASTTATLTTDDYASPPASALLVVPELTGSTMGDVVYGQLQESLEYHPQLTIDFAFKAPDFNSAANLSILRLANTSSTWSVSVDVIGTNLTLTPDVVDADGGQTYTAQYFAQPDLTQWTTISLFLDLANDVASVSYNGTVVSSGLTLDAPDLAATGGSLLLAIGLNYSTEPLPTPIHLYYDDIDIEAQ